MCLVASLSFLFYEMIYGHGEYYRDQTEYTCKFICTCEFIYTCAFVILLWLFIKYLSKLFIFFGFNIGRSPVPRNVLISLWFFQLTEYRFSNSFLSMSVVNIFYIFFSFQKERGKGKHSQGKSSQCFKHKVLW